MISRRSFLKVLAAGAAVYPFKNAMAAKKNEKILNLHNTHTGENLEIKYCISGAYDHEALNEINYFLRCHYANEIKTLDVKLLDLLSEIQNIAGKDKQAQIISGYRSVAYNEYLRGIGKGVSKNSLHLQGLAIDFTISGVSNHELFRIAKSFAAGGVGLYPEFVHIDTGRIRYW
ncbi:MAG: DUF882 domain-containing protein [Thermodesulfovibrionales bacterium]|nr:DUF882 domain-containing protein [Thermodesulfovibrionales bacterium]